MITEVLGFGFLFCHVNEFLASVINFQDLCQVSKKDFVFPPCRPKIDFTNFFCFRILNVLSTITISHLRPNSIDFNKFPMKITKVRAKLYQWKSPIKTADTIFATPLSLLPFQDDLQAPFRFFSWLVVEIETDAGHTGIGNAGLCPDLCKKIVDGNWLLYLSTKTLSILNTCTKKCIVPVWPMEEKELYLPLSAP